MVRLSDQTVPQQIPRYLSARRMISDGRFHALAEGINADRTLRRKPIQRGRSTAEIRSSGRLRYRTPARHAQGSGRRPRHQQDRRADAETDKAEANPAQAQDDVIMWLPIRQAPALHCRCRAYQSSSATQFYSRSQPDNHGAWSTSKPTPTGATRPGSWKWATLQFAAGAFTRRKNDQPMVESLPVWHGRPAPTRSAGLSHAGANLSEPRADRKADPPISPGSKWTKAKSAIIAPRPGTDGIRGPIPVGSISAPMGASRNRRTRCCSTHCARYRRPDTEQQAARLVDAK